MSGAVLGLVDGISDAGAALFRDGDLVAAVNEERLSGVKMQGGFPAGSIAEVLRVGAVDPGEVTEIVVAGRNTPALATRLCRPLQRRLAPTAGIIFDRPWSLTQRLADLLRYRVRLTTNRPGSRLGGFEARLAGAVLRRQVGRRFRRADLTLVDHHHAHAAAAFFASPFPRALVVTADSLGDGVSLTISRGRGASLERLWSVGPFASFGNFYALVTKFLGFEPYRHEGKVSALAASGDAARIPLPFPLQGTGARVEYRGEWGLRAWRWLEPLRGCAREDVAAWLQQGTEAGIVAVLRRFLDAEKPCDLCVAGGLFANVRLNLRLLETPGVGRLFVFPHMGDGGLAVGGVLARHAPPGWRLPALFLGPDCTERACEEALRGVPHERPRDPEAELAALLARGQVVARCAGRMEYGPRALGNRSVLAEAVAPDIRRELNRRLARTEFMPFAPVTLAEAAGACYREIERAGGPARHMTCAFHATPKLTEEAPGAVHVDGTARCQLATREETPELHRLLAAYESRTGRATLINTSLNRHESPMACTPQDAVRTFLDAELDALQLGPFLARRDPRR